MVTEPLLPSALTLTGERTLPGIWHENYWLRRHEVAYDVFAPTCVGVRVLEAGCGEGYGGARLCAAGARVVVAIDLDVPTLRHVRATYPAVTAVRANLVLLPCADASLDVVVSAQTIEHLWDQDRFVRECARVLRPGGLLLMSTPNRRTFPPGNVFHSRELDVDELVALVRPHLDPVRVAGVAHGPRLRDWTDRHGDVVAAQLATSPAAWHDDLSTLVRSVSVDDFTVTDGAVPDGAVPDRAVPDRAGGGRRVNDIVGSRRVNDIVGDASLGGDPIDSSLDLIVVARRT